ncbi:zinc ribbon domain-containing protein [Bifidobacterium callitrichos]|uniref:Zinc ribbon domain-containing protein n=1 Tax=Bifidobacterium callitrichos TaxID=762209 RepID=A0A5M9ZET5_9BIFI|nr:zinc ribbon domain-containing protein [Bifidobacterium callitrichos]KAA8817606.1 zinc ribbon domain-containing protein [Bifidobacterium callitrichos]
MNNDPHSEGNPASPIAKPIYCTQCGTSLRTTAKFCSHCGTKVAIPPVDLQTVIPDVTGEPHEPPVQRLAPYPDIKIRNGNNGLRKVIICLIIAAILIGCGIAIVNSHKENNPTVLETVSAKLSGGEAILSGEQAKMNTERVTDDVSGLSLDIPIAGTQFKKTTPATAGVDDPYDVNSSLTYATTYESANVDMSVFSKIDPNSNTLPADMPDTFIDITTSVYANHNYIMSKAPQLESGTVPSRYGNPTPCDITKHKSGDIDLTVCTMQQLSSAWIVVTKNQQTVAIINILVLKFNKNGWETAYRKLDKDLQQYSNDNDAGSSSGGDSDLSQAAQTAIQPSMPHLRYAVNHLNIR